MGSDDWHVVATQAALAARTRAHAPYSKFQVGAALVGGGQVISGANIENASYGATICAERVAACAAWSAGVEVWDGMAIASPGGVAPCGVCRQFLSELAPVLPLLLVDADTGETRITSLDELFPMAFRLEQE